MEKQNYQFVFKWYIKLILYFILTILLAPIIINSCKLIGLFNIYSYNNSLDIATIIASIAIASIIIATIYYSFYIIKEDSLKIYIGLFNQEIKFKNILKFVHNESDNQLWILFTNKNLRAAALINIDPSKIDAFIASIKQIYPSINYEKVKELK